VDLSVVTVLVTPLKVLVRGLLQVHLNVLQSVLLDVTNAEVRVLLNLSGRRNGLASKELNKCRLSSTVGANNSNTRRQAQLTRDIL
jgi:hypothetical protein